MAITNAIASLAVKDLALSLKWFARLFRRDADTRPTPELAEWKFEDGVGLQIYQLPERAGACSVTLSVDDLDEEIANLELMKIDTSERPANSKMRTVMISDPDGNHIAFVQRVFEYMAR